MTDIRSRHVPSYDRDGDPLGCIVDGDDMPCDAIREADEKDKLQELVLGQTSLISGLSANVSDEAARADKAEAALAECVDEYEAVLARAVKAEAALAAERRQYGIAMKNLLIERNAARADAKALAAALRAIARLDYRGHESVEMRIARDALAKWEASRAK